MAWYLSRLRVARECPNNMTKIFTAFFLLLCLATTAQKKKIQDYYNPFKGSITVVGDDAIKFDNEIMILYETDVKYRGIFENGLLYPKLFGVAAPETVKAKNGKELINHNLTVSKFELVNMTADAGTVRKYKFRVLRKDEAKATEYFIKLANKNASVKTDTNTFVKGARLVWLKPGAQVM